MDRQSQYTPELLRILGTIVVAVGVFLGSWLAAQAGWLDAAAMFLTIFIVGFARDRIERGLIKTPDMIGRVVPDTPKEMTGSFRNVRWLALSVYQGAEEWRERSPNLRPLLWCAGVALLYIAAKAAFVQVLTVVTNPALLVLAGGCAIGFLLAPGYFSDLIRRYKVKPEKRSDDTDWDEAAA